MNARLSALDTLSTCLTIDKTSRQLENLDRRVSTGQIDWPQILGLANANLVSSCLAAELSIHGLDQKLPVELRDFLGEIKKLNTMRNQRLREQTIEAIGAFNSIDVEPILLKGVVSLFVKTYPHPGARMLTDIDILVPRQNADACWHLLRGLGYAPTESDGDFSKHNHLHPLVRPGDYAVVEIHRDVLKPTRTGRLFGASLEPEDMEHITQMVIDQAEQLEHDDLIMATPSPTFRVLHCLLHSALTEFNAYRSGILPLRSIHELALLQSRFETQIDWDIISRFAAARDLSRVVRAWVYLAHRLFGSKLPVGWNTTAAMRAHYTRCRLQARWALSITLRHIERI